MSLAYAGACVVPLLVIVAVMVRSPVRADAVATEGEATSASTASSLPSGSIMILPVADKSGVARPGPSGATSPGPRPTVPPIDPAKPRVIQSTAVLRDAMDVLHKQIQQRQMHDAIGSLRRLLELDPNTVNDDGVRADIVALTLDVLKLPKPDPDDMFEMLVSGMGTTGIDILYQIMTSHGGMAAADYSKDLLAREDVRSRGSPALQAAYAIRSAKNCDDVRAAFPAAKADGDKRALGLLYELQKGCGRRRYAVCCLDNDKEIAEVINAMHTRLGVRF